MPIIRKLVALFLLVSILSSCTSNVGRFSVLSTHSVRGLEYNGTSRSDVMEVKGTVCENRLYLSRTITGFVFIIPWFMKSFDIVWGQDDRKLEVATYRAIKEGKKSVHDGDMLIDANVKESSLLVPLIYGRYCTMVEGNVVSSVTRTKGFLEKKSTFKKED